MADNNFKEYTGVSRAAFDQVRREQGKDSDSFNIEKSGVTLLVEYTETTQTVKMTITNKPSFIPDSMIWAVVDETVKKG